MKRVVLAVAFMLLSLPASSAWARTQANYQRMYCPIGTKLYGKRVRYDIRSCDGVMRRVPLSVRRKQV
jgi:hypothetical protein